MRSGRINHRLGAAAGVRFGMGVPLGREGFARGPRGAAILRNLVRTPPPVNPERGPRVCGSLDAARLFLRSGRAGMRGC